MQSHVALELLFLLTVASCSGGSLDPGSPDSDVNGPDASNSDAGYDGGDEPCGQVVCGSGQTCVDGRCVSDDCCAHITCPNEGEVCRGCECVAGAADVDGDGFVAQEDCDDDDVSIIPGSTRPCYSECGAPGFEVCRAGGWVDCNAPIQCDCTPGEVENVECGMCGSATRTCLDDGSWGATGACTGEGVCMVGSTQSQGCGWCGTEQRTCDASCQWGSWGACTGEGVCAAGSSEIQWCGRCGSQSRTCGELCSWGVWGSCAEESVDRTAWSRINDLGVDSIQCAGGVLLGVGTRELDGDWHLDDMAVECCSLVPLAGGACTWTAQRSIASEGNAQFICPAGHAMVGVETEEWGEDEKVDNLRTRCCPTTVTTTTCAWEAWVGVAAEGEFWLTCPAGSVAVGLETNEFGGDWLVDSMRVQCCR